MNIAGIDYSISCPSICIYDLNKKFNYKNCNFYLNQQHVTKKEQNRRSTLNLNNIFFSYRINSNSNEEQYYFLADWALSILILNNVNKVILESYALGAKGKVFNIAEATGILKHYLFLNNINIYTYTPSFNKKSFSGKGNANKEYMISVFNEKNKISISEELGLKKDFTLSPISDIVDSYSLIETYIKESQIYYE